MCLSKVRSYIASYLARPQNLFLSVFIGVFVRKLWQLLIMVDVALDVAELEWFNHCKTVRLALNNVFEIVVPAARKSIVEKNLKKFYNFFDLFFRVVSLIKRIIKEYIDSVWEERLRRRERDHMYSKYRAWA